MSFSLKFLGGRRARTCHKPDFRRVQRAPKRGQHPFCAPKWKVRNDRCFCAHSLCSLWMCSSQVVFRWPTLPSRGGRRARTCHKPDFRRVQRAPKRGQHPFCAPKPHFAHIILSRPWDPRPRGTKGSQKGAGRCEAAERASNAQRVIWAQISRTCRSAHWCLYVAVIACLHT